MSWANLILGNLEVTEETAIKTSTHFLLVPEDAYIQAPQPQLCFWLQVVPFDPLPEFNSLLNFISKHQNTFKTYKTFPSHDLPSESVTVQNTKRPEFTNRLIAQPSFPAAWKFFYDVIDIQTDHALKIFYEIILVHFLGLQAELRLQFHESPDTKNYGNTLIQSSRSLRLHFDDAMKKFRQAFSSSLPNDETIYHAKNHYAKAMHRLIYSSNIPQFRLYFFLRRLDLITDERYDLKPLIRLFDYFINNRKLKRREITQRKLSIETESSSQLHQFDPNVRNFSPNINEQKYSPTKIATEDGLKTIQAITDGGDSPEELHNIPKVYSTYIYEGYVTKQSAIEKNLSSSALISPAKGISGRSQVAAARDAKKHILKKRLRLIESWENLSSPEVQHLISRLYDNVYQNKENSSEPSLGLLLSLTFGQHIGTFYFCSHVDDLKNKDIKDKMVFCLEDNLVYYRAQIPSYKSEIAPSVVQYFMSSGSLGCLAPPLLIVKELINLTLSKTVSGRIRPLFHQEEIDQAHEILKSINKTYSTRLSLERVVNQLSFVVLNQFGDKGLLGLLGLLKQDISTQNHYANASVQKINEKYQMALKSFPFESVIDKQKRDGFFNFKEITKANRIGSRNLISQAYVDDLIDRLNLLVPDMESKSICEKHNFMVAYAYFLVQFFTGARPSKNLLEDLRKFDLLNNILFISDKDTQDNFSTRAVPVHPILSKQLIALKQHLAFFQPLRLPSQDRLKVYFLDGLENVEGFEVQRCFSILGIDTNMPKNFLRAWFRDLMIDYTNFGQNADIILSHWDAGEEFHGRYSTFDLVSLGERYDLAWKKYAENHRLPAVMEFFK